MATQSPLTKLKGMTWEGGRMSVYRIAILLGVSYNRAHCWDNGFGKPNAVNQAKIAALELELEAKGKE